MNRRLWGRRAEFLYRWRLYRNCFIWRNSWQIGYAAWILMDPPPFFFLNEMTCFKKNTWMIFVWVFRLEFDLFQKLRNLLSSALIVVTRAAMTDTLQKYYPCDQHCGCRWIRRGFMDHFQTEHYAELLRNYHLVPWEGYKNAPASRVRPPAWNPGSQESVGKEVSKYLDSGCTRLQLLGRPCLELKASLVR